MLKFTEHSMFGNDTTCEFCLNTCYQILWMGYVSYSSVCDACVYSLVRPEHIEDLVNMVIQQPDEEMDDKARYK